MRSLHLGFGIEPDLVFVFPEAGTGDAGCQKNSVEDRVPWVFWIDRILICPRSVPLPGSPVRLLNVLCLVTQHTKATPTYP